MAVMCRFLNMRLLGSSKPDSKCDGKSPKSLTPSLDKKEPLQVYPKQRKQLKFRKTATEGVSPDGKGVL
jgi:hypothetical protein